MPESMEEQRLFSCQEVLKKLQLHHTEKYNERESSCTRRTKIASKMWKVQNECRQNV